jgi:hypothetical protein
MAIQEITDTEIVQRCAGCDRENRVALANLAVGVERDDQVEDGVIPLPECPTCRSREFRLFRGIRGSISARQRNIGRECHGRRGCQRFPRSQTRSALRAVDSPWLRPWQEGLYGSKALALLPVQQAGV